MPQYLSYSEKYPQPENILCSTPLFVFLLSITTALLHYLEVSSLFKLFGDGHIGLSS